MTPRQRDALRWLEQVGEVSEWTLNRTKPFQARTLDALAEQGRIHVQVVEGRTRPYRVWTHPSRVEVTA
jgi:hypothetical protein